MDWVSTLHWLRTVPQWGNVPAWAAFISAAIAAIVTFKNYKAARRQLTLAQETRRAEVEEGERRQASLVAAWFTGDESGECAIISGWNGSGSPVYNVKISMAAGSGRSRQLILQDVFPPSADRLELTGATREFRRLHGDVSWDPQKMYFDGHYKLSISFRDAAGLSWTRGFDGKLERSESPWMAAIDSEAGER